MNGVLTNDGFSASESVCSARHACRVPSVNLAHCSLHSPICESASDTRSITITWYPAVNLMAAPHSVLNAHPDL